MRFQPFLPEDATSERPWWFVFRGDRLLVGPRAEVPRHNELSELGIEADGQFLFGSVDGAPAYAVRADRAADPAEGLEFTGLRELFAAVGDDLFRIAGRAKQIATWDRDHRYCGRCGALTRDRPGERVKECTGCGHLSFPRLSPAMITAVIRDDRILLARARRFPPGFYSVLAGFVEAGETLEECVEREVQEEVGIRVRDIRYFGSQSWPFPHSMMIAFTARWARGEISINDAEICEADWYRADRLPDRIPDRASISRRLIDSFAKGTAGELQV